MKMEMYLIDKLAGDTCWSIITGADNHVYMASCTEYRGGNGVFLVRYNTVKKKIEYMLDVANAVGQPPDNGRATQCKIHYSLLSDLEGVIYGATHLSSPGRGERFYSPWNCWKDEKRGFPGAMLFAFEPKTEKVLFYDCICPHEGCRCLALDQKRKILYGVTYPRNHFFYYDIDKRKQVDIGRIGNVNPQAVFLDRRNRAYTNNDYGQLLRFDLDTGRMEELDVRVPHAPYQDGLHTILYDVVPVPGENAVIGVPWSTDPHFFKYTCDDGQGPGKMEDLGPTVHNRDGFYNSRIQSDHTGGLVFGKDGMLYYSANLPTLKPQKGRRWDAGLTLFMRMDPKTGRKEKIQQIKFPGFITWYVSRAVRDLAGHLYLADVGNVPCRMYKVTPDYPAKVKNKKEPKDVIIRNWG